MKIRAIRVNQWRKFTKPAGIEGLGDGLNVLSAPNEAGKSTLVGALQLALFTRHSTTGRDVDALLNHAAPNSPVVEVEFEIDGQPYTLRKRFKRGSQVKLVKPDGAELQGEGAEAFVAELLGFTFPGRGTGTADTMGLWSLLWLNQGDGADPISAPDGAQRTVMGALEDTVGNLLGGEQGRRLPLKIRGDLQQLVTESKGQPKDRYKKAIERVGKLDGELGELKAAFARTESDLQAYEDVCAALNEKEGSSTEAELKRDIQAANDRVEELLTLEAEIGAAESDAERLEQQRRDALQAKLAREQLAAAIDALVKDVEAAEKTVANAREEEARLESLWQDARAAQRRADRARAEADSALRQATNRLTGAQRSGELATLSRAVADAESATAAIVVLEARVNASKATPEAVAALDDLMDEVRAAQAAMTAVATLVEFALEDAASTRVTLSQGVMPPPGETLALMDPTEVRIEGIGVIGIRPQVADAAVMQENLQRAEQALSAALAAIDAADIPAARQLLRNREAAERDLTEARASLERIAPENDGGLAGVRERRERARAELEQLEAAGLNLAALPTLEAARAAREEAANAAEAAAHEAGQATQAATQCRAALDEHRDTLRAPESALSAGAAQLAARQEALGNMPAEHTLQERLAAASDAVEQQKAVIRALRQKAGGDSVELSRARLVRLQQSLESYRHGINDLQSRKMSLKTTLMRDGAAGIGEKTAAKARELELAVAERDRLDREARILGTLNAVLTDAEREARDRFLGPITEKVRPYLQALFPEADIQLADSLGVESVYRGAGETPDFAALSMGTREQINILTRIAIAEMMAEQGRPAMVIIDDGLVHSDDQRLQRMFDILNLAAERVQILLLSCHAKTFERAGGRLLSIEAFEETEGLRSH
ncbi:AAA family ATPase [Chromatocurvus halotolerans]|uniref:DNA repair exonuclease SbcCD ATPase subunit n=1 Tax=Chromatocurvus halotolerans TaxID=1132028 RepID=A0A4R2L9Z9_9GAMM|nr:AAA family ATPase [Chromatocurvus halotolerans]TCO76075.1 DNA repair exonuclease SbcCD ATPase subunit [Chromatocurvus halotolerans]